MSVPVAKLYLSYELSAIQADSYKRLYVLTITWKSRGRVEVQSVSLSIFPSSPQLLSPIRSGLNWLTGVVPVYKVGILAVSRLDLKSSCNFPD